jgi:hypothetical protein
MQQAHQRLLWTQQWLTGVLETGTPSKVPEDPSDDTQATTHAKDFESPATGTDTSFEIVSHKDDDFGVVSIPDFSAPPWKYTQQPPPSHCASCGWPWPPSPPLTYSEQMPPQQPIPDLELAGRGDHSHAFSDLRSPSVARQRDRSAREKYYRFRYVKRGELGSQGVVEGTSSSPCCDAEEEEEEEEETEHADSDDDDDDDDEGDASSRAGTPCSIRSCSTERPPRPTTTADHAPPHPTEEIDKHTLYRLAQLYPRPPKNHHRHIDKVTAPLSQRVDKRREERKHQKAILRDEVKDLSPQKSRIR